MFKLYGDEPARFSFTNFIVKESQKKYNWPRRLAMLLISPLLYAMIVVVIGLFLIAFPIIILHPGFNVNEKPDGPK